MEIEGKLKTVDQLKSKIEGYGKLSPEVLRKINYKFRLDWNYYSNNMEGNTLTKDETRSIMIGNITIHGKPIRDVLEMRGHDDAITDILKIGKGELNISEKRMRDIHKAIMHEETEENKKKVGNWKTVDNYILNYKDERFDFVKAAEVQEEMHKLINWLSGENEKLGKKGSLHPAILAIEFHLRYLTIHPFYDGNGRTARILMNLILISKGYPPIIIKTEDKTKYYQYLADIQGYSGSKDFYYSLMLDLLIHSMELVDTAINGGDIEEPDDIDKRIELLKKKLDKTDVVTEVKSLYSTNKVLGENIFPMLQQLEEKLAKLKDLFHSTDRRMQYTEHGNTFQLGSNESTWENLYGNWLKSRTPEKENIDLSGISEFTYTYQLKGYKKSLKLQYVNIYFVFQFYEFDYSIRINNDHNNQPRFGYSQMIDKKIATEIVRDQVDRVIKQIAEASDIKE
jgi:Fic family protein